MMEIIISVALLLVLYKHVEKELKVNRRMNPDWSAVEKGPTAGRNRGQEVDRWKWNGSNGSDASWTVWPSRGNKSTSAKFGSNEKERARAGRRESCCFQLLHSWAAEHFHIHPNLSVRLPSSSAMETTDTPDQRGGLALECPPWNGHVQIQTIGLQTSWLTLSS